MINATGFDDYCIWEHSAQVRELYEQRCKGQAQEMTCHAQAAELFAPHIAPGDTLLDAGCGSGYFYHSLKARELPVEYWGVDQAKTLIDIGRASLPQHGLPPERLVHLRLEDLRADMDHVACINVLSNIDNFHRPLERLLHTARKTLVLRESLAKAASYNYVEDKYLDQGHRLKVHVNTYALDEVCDFIRAHDFEPTVITDRRTGGKPEMVIDHPHHWTFIQAIRH